MIAFPFQRTAHREARLIGFESYTGRLANELGQHIGRGTGPVDWAAGASKTLFGENLGLQPLAQDLAGYIDGGRRSIPRRTGLIPHTREAVFGALRDVRDGHPISGLVKAVGVVGAAISDAGNTAAGISYN